MGRHLFGGLIMLFVMVCGCDGERNSVPKPTEPIVITTPTDGAAIEHRAMVRGRVLDAKSAVYLVVRPMATSSYWVQPPVDTDENGSWSVQVYIGRAPNENSGEHFKMMAVANPATPIKEGDILTEWPKAQWRSRIIEVTEQ